MKQKFKELKVNDRVKTLHSGMATVVAVGYNAGIMVKLDCDVKKWNCPYFYEHELDFGEEDIDEQDIDEQDIKQTAVEWLVSQMKDNRFLSAFEEEIEQAKEMEKEQQGYSEEELLQILESYAEWSINGDCTYYEWFEQFKKK